MSRKALIPLVCAAIAGVAAGVAIGALHRHARAVRPAIPEFHGQATWKAGVRRAPQFALRDQTGALVSLRALRGRTVLLTFLDSKCTQECPLAGRELGSIMRNLPPSQRPTIVVVSVDPRGDTPRSIRHALAKWKLNGPWTVHWLNAPTRARLKRVWDAYGIVVEPTTGDIVHSLALLLVDRHGDERTAYLFPFLPSFVQHDLAKLAA